MVVDGDIPPFGYLPFDEFIIQKWNPDSPLSKQGQKRFLLQEWIELGKFGRNEYFTDPRFPEEIPPSIPTDLLSDHDRIVDGQISGTLWIRTWFGLPDNQESQDAADAAYKRLLLAVMQQGDPDCEYNECMDDRFIFDNKDEFFEEGVNPRDVVDGIAVGTPGSLPGYLFTALLHCPDQFDGATSAEYHHARIERLLREIGEEDMDRRQCLLVLVADREACEEGWVLHLAINHRGRVLPFRRRDAASYVSGNVGCWDEQEPLREYTASEQDLEVEYYARGGSGWH